MNFPNLVWWGGVYQNLSYEMAVLNALYVLVFAEIGSFSIVEGHKCLS